MTVIAFKPLAEQPYDVQQRVRARLIPKPHPFDFCLTLMFWRLK